MWRKFVLHTIQAPYSTTHYILKPHSINNTHD